MLEYYYLYYIRKILSYNPETLRQISCAGQDKLGIKQYQQHKIQKII